MGGSTMMRMSIQGHFIFLQITLDHPVDADGLPIVAMHRHTTAHSTVPPASHALGPGGMQCHATIAIT